MAQGRFFSAPPGLSRAVVGIPATTGTLRCISVPHQTGAALRCNWRATSNRSGRLHAYRGGAARCFTAFPQRCSVVVSRRNERWRWVTMDELSVEKMPPTFPRRRGWWKSLSARPLRAARVAGTDATSNNTDPPESVIFFHGNGDTYASTLSGSSRCIGDRDGYEDRLAVAARLWKSE